VQRQEEIIFQAWLCRNESHIIQKIEANEHIF
jgi:hypothetical protein